MNIAERLVDWANKTPSNIAISVPKKKFFGGYDYPSLTFQELNERTEKLASEFTSFGLTEGMKVLVFVRPGLNFSAITFALFKMGMVPVFIDPGMGRKNLLHAIAHIKPIAMIAEPEVHFIRLFFKKNFSSIKYFITTGKLSWGKMRTLSSMLNSTKKVNFEMKNYNGDETAAVLFTSGGTGVPKGVRYTHKIFWNQTDMLQELYSLTPEDKDVPGFPLFSLFTIAMGMESSIPAMNPSKPAKANPKKLVQNILDKKATFVAGSPAIWEGVADYCLRNAITLPSIRCLVMFGAPIRTELHRKFKIILTNGTTYTPYGATECLPVANTSGKYILESSRIKNSQGIGTCLGMPAPGVDVKIMQITDSAVESFNNVETQNINTIGEIIVQGPTVTPEYVDMPEKTREAKIFEDNGVIWHRMGDLGYLDENGNLWFCGRKSHRVETNHGLMSSIQCEDIFNRHGLVKRSALIGLGNPGLQRPAIVIERKDGKTLKGKNKIVFERELLKLAQGHKLTQGITDIYYHASFPVDVRHNIKIDRLKLRDAAAEGSLQ